MRSYWIPAFIHITIGIYIMNITSITKLSICRTNLRKLPTISLPVHPITSSHLNTIVISVQVVLIRYTTFNLIIICNIILSSNRCIYSYKTINIKIIVVCKILAAIMATFPP